MLETWPRSSKGDEATGARIVARPLEEPLKQIAVNAGLEGGVVVERVRNLDSATEGLNAATGEYEDLVKAGIIDAAKVTRSALQNAASIAALFLTTEAVIADKPEEAAPAPCPAAAWRTSEALEVGRHRRPAFDDGPPLRGGPSSSRAHLTTGEGASRRQPRCTVDVVRWLRRRHERGGPHSRAVWLGPKNRIGVSPATANNGMKTSAALRSFHVTAKPDGDGDRVGARR